ncbi:hypothetical protein F5884DRAFT_832286 [Xylogone sp. PMI_703]|nr:hypothetical protein F5884DRAFT_832286 [Xylogone sp. PMI_703]
MATLLELEKIKANPINNSLDTFRHLFESTPIKNLVLDLIQTLQIEPAARALPSRIASRTLSGDLAITYGRVDSNELDLVSAIPLVEKIVCNESAAPSLVDVEIWIAVFEFVSETRPKATTPPTALANAVLDTPFRSSSASQTGVEQTHYEVDRRIIEEFTGRVYYDVKGFYKRYFEGKLWTEEVNDIYQGCTSHYDEGQWSNWPNPPVQDLFFEWFMNFQDNFRGRFRRKYYTSANKVLKGSEASRKLDIFLADNDVASESLQHDWSTVLVIGEHKQNPDEDDSTATLIQLAGYAREVFGSQPDRRFVPGFTICGSLMRLWIFDRSGAYSSTKFDIHKEPERFVKVIAGYTLMADAELGLNTFIKHDGKNKYVIARDVKIYLENKPIASQRAVVCRGTACYRGRECNSEDWKYVVKFAWPSDKRQREGKLLKLATERGVKGIAQWFHHEQVLIDGNPDTIAGLRSSMEFEQPRKLSTKVLWVDGATDSSRTDSKTRKQNVKETGSHKLDTLSIQEPDTDSLAGQESETYDNPGRPLHAYKSVRGLLEAFRDAITGHKSLLENGKILHQDISENNIIITEPITEEDSREEGPRGRLIDLDLAKELDSAPSGASHRTGTMQFMAIEVLQGKGHTYRHDLESFFYVFIWMCIRYGYGNPGDGKIRKSRSVVTSRLRGWYTGIYSEIGRNKLGDMDKNGFEAIIAEFAPQFEEQKQLARELRSVLFRIRDGAIFTDTFRNSDIMYDGMINAFNAAISRLEEGE